MFLVFHRDMDMQKSVVPLDALFLISNNFEPKPKSKVEPITSFILKRLWLEKNDTKFCTSWLMMNIRLKSTRNTSYSSNILIEINILGVSYLINIPLKFYFLQFHQTPNETPNRPVPGVREMIRYCAPYLDVPRPKPTNGRSFNRVKRRESGRNPRKNVSFTLW